MKPLLIILAILVVGFVAIGFIRSQEQMSQTSSQTEIVMVEGNTFTVDSIGSLSVVPNGITLTFENGTVSGTDGCNRYSASYTLSGNQVQISPAMSTQMACPEAIMNTAADFQQALTQSASFLQQGDSVVMLDSNGEVLLTMSPQSQDLSGTTWVVTGYNNGQQAVTSPVVGTTMTLEFGTEGTFSASAGCNQINGNYQTEAGTIEMTDILQTLMFCADPEGVMDQEMQFVTALGNANTYALEAGSLVIRDDQGAMQVTATSN